MENPHNIENLAEKFKFKAEKESLSEEQVIADLDGKYDQITRGYSPDKFKTISDKVENVTKNLSRRLQTSEGFEFGEIQKKLLQLKVLRHYQHHDSIDINTIYDAIIETPKFINQEKGSLHKLLEVHEVKTLQKVAEIRKRRAEMNGETESNPYEYLFQTEDGQYCMARLLNMPHLEQESEYLTHCVGTSDSYINKIKRGDLEIFSFRTAPTKEQADEPLLTIEYNLKTKIIKQIKGYNDSYIKPQDPHYWAFLNSLEELYKTKTDTGDYRDFKKIEESEMVHLRAFDNCVLTVNGQIHIENYDPEKHGFILKEGKMQLLKDSSAEMRAAITKFKLGEELQPEQIAFGLDEITKDTKMYIGKWTPDTMKNVPESIKYLYREFPENKIFRKDLTITPKSYEEYESAFKELGCNITAFAQDKLIKNLPEQSAVENIKLVGFTIKELGLSDKENTEYKYVVEMGIELGLALCNPHTGPQLRLAYTDQEEQDGFYVMSEELAFPEDIDYDPTVFYINKSEGDLDLWTQDSVYFREHEVVVFEIKQEQK